MDCLFCKIVKGTIPCQKIYEDENILAFRDIHPQAPVHYLFIPKEHIVNVSDLKDAKKSVMGDLFVAIRSVAQKEGFAEKGYRVVTNTNQEGGQVVYHLHLHLLAGQRMGGNLVGV